MILQECPPRLRWRFGMADHVFGNRGFGDLNAQLEQFAVDSRRSPAHIVSTQSPYEFPNLFRNRWPTGPSMPNFVGPVPTKTSTVPIDDGGRFYDPECRTPSRPELR